MAMICCCVSAPITKRRFIDALLPEPTAVVTGRSRLYFIYHVQGRGRDGAYHDPTDGELLIEERFFIDEAAARAWAKADDACRNGEVRR